ncbi:MAG: Bbp16 family capsid cement protein [Stappiaceae bacterium]
MILDERLEFADAESVTGGTGTSLVGDVVDLETARNIGVETSLYLVISVDGAVDSAGNGAAIEFALVSDAAEAISTDGSATEHASTGAIAQADLAAGSQFSLAVPQGLTNAYEQYLGVLATISGEAVTAGTVNAFLTPHPSANTIYPEGQN